MLLLFGGGRKVKRMLSCSLTFVTARRDGRSRDYINAHASLFIQILISQYEKNLVSRHVTRRQVELMHVKSNIHIPYRLTESKP